MRQSALSGARTHNLKNLNLSLRSGEVVVISGVSGSGKSSLALDTLYAEGQRRFVESFSPYARQFLERLERPDMDSLEPVPAGIAVDRRAPVKSSRSTVASMADLSPYLSALFAREARPLCAEHGVEAEQLDARQAAERALAELRGERAVVCYPLAVAGTEHYLEVRESLAANGYRRLWLGGKARDLDSVRPSDAMVGGSLSVVVDRLNGKPADMARMAAGIEEAWSRSGSAELYAADARLLLKPGLACPECGSEFPEPRPSLFSYESPLGACSHCRGFGRTIGVDLDKVIPDPTLSLVKRAIRPWSGKSTTWERAELNKLCKRHGIDVNKPFRQLSARQQKLVLEGDGSWDEGLFPGVLGWFRWLETRTYKMHVRVLLSRYRSYDECAVCKGQRLNPAALAYRVGGRNLAEWHAREITTALADLEALAPRTGQGELARRELSDRLRYLERVGLGYLTLDRQARTLSGGEAQRVTLTAALGTSLHSALFVLDEPSVGLHPRDVARLTEVFAELAARDNTVVVVEHDAAIIRAADRVVELGPGAGAEGGWLVADGTPAELVKRRGATARALTARPPAQTKARKPRGELRVLAARANNLREPEVRLPLGVFCALTGVSGSGKSTLAVDVVYRALARRLGVRDVEAPGAHQAIEGAQGIKRVTLVDQSPLGRTSRGNAATYTKAWDFLRKRLAAEPTALARGFAAADFSFNVDGGRCEACSGEGYETVEMQFLADVRLLCPVCKGRRFKDEILAIEHLGFSVADLLELTVTDTLAAFRSQVQLQRTLGPLEKLGLGYLRLGQPLSTLSGGEAQRLKLARALAEPADGTLFVLDEPSAGLHADEVEHVFSAIDILVEAGASVLAVEHDLQLIARADHVLDLGPEAGALGGRLVAAGTPREVARSQSHTGRALAEYFQPSNSTPRAPKPRVVPVHTALSVTRAREHNLKSVSVEIPHGALSVVTGPSGSGKSSLCFDVVFAEGQRRFLETLTPYARQFLPSMPRPDVDAVSGVPPAIALEQRTSRAGPRSTVATVTEVAHYLRLLFAKLGDPHCPVHDRSISALAESELVAKLRAKKGVFELLAPAVEARKGTYLDVFNAAARAGIQQAICDGARVDTDQPPKLARNREHDIDLVLARGEARSFDAQLVQKALTWGKGSLKLVPQNGRGSALRLSTRRSCPECGYSLPALDPRWFSFNTKQGRCETCQGNGVVEGAQRRRGRKSAVASPPVICPDCGGARLAPAPRAVRLQGERYHEFCAHSAAVALARVERWRFTGERGAVASAALEELRRRLAFMCEVGLDYLALDRSAQSLSGGEMQRLRLAAQLGAGLTGALYVLDEPTIGLHPRDTRRLLDNLRSLKDTGSTILMVEHDAETIRAADHLIDLGPAGGSGGGELVAQGTPAQVLANPRSPTGRALSRPPRLRERLPVAASAAMLSLSGAAQHNLRHVDLKLPLGRFNVVAGVSGSGKSTLVRQVLLPALRRALGLASGEPGLHAALGGYHCLKRAVAVDQSPIGRTPRSVPATFLGIWDQIRTLYAATPDAQVAGFNRTRFSFNTPSGGRCTTCDGQGVITHEMSFMPDVTTSCPSCDGLRFEPRTLEVRYFGRSVGEVLRMTAEEAAQAFKNHPEVSRPLSTLTELGAGYITLGQGSHTLSGGEAQRLKLAAELTATARHEATLYVLDEPTTGLHLSDVERLMSVLSRLIDRGDTLVVIEHHPDVIAGADWVVELGPEGGERGGRIVYSGPPDKLASRASATGRVLAQLGVFDATAKKRRSSPMRVSRASCG